MILYPRFKIYELYTNQKKCGYCSNEINIHDMEVENIVEDKLICYECLEEKKNIISDYDKKQSITEMNLRPLEKFMATTKQLELEEFHFSREPIIVSTDFSYVNEAYEEDEIESNIDPEEKIQTSWYHRAILGDENREIYDDGEDTNFEEVEEYWRLKHEEEELEELEWDDSNSQLVSDYKN